MPKKGVMFYNLTNTGYTTDGIRSTPQADNNNKPVEITYGQIAVEGWD